MEIFFVVMNMWVTERLREQPLVKLMGWQRAP